MRKVYSQKMRESLQLGKKLLVGYLLAGYPNIETSLECIKICAENNVDILEMGYPSENPYCDGEVISKAHKLVDLPQSRSVEYFYKVRTIFKGPIWLMGYKDDLFINDEYLKLVENKLIDGLVLPNASESEREIILNIVAPYNVDVIGFTNPSMSDTDLSDILNKHALVYQQLYVGQTGKSEISDQYLYMLQYSMQFKDSYHFAGFGINTSERVKELYDSGFDGAIIGTELLRRINISTSELQSFLQSMPH